MADPIAIIKSRTHSDSSIVVIVDETDNHKDEKNGFNGNDVIGAITIGTRGIINDYLIDADRIGSYYGRQGNEVINLFTEALINESSSDPRVLYINKERDRITLKKRNTQPVTLQKGEHSSENNIQQNQGTVNKNTLKAAAKLQKKIEDALNAIDEMNPDENGILHKVNKIAQKERIFEKITDTRQFRNFFGRSKVVDGNGKPLVLYTGTNAAQAAEDDALSGVYLETVQRGGQEAVYASIRKPFRADNPAALQRYLKRDAQYRQLMANGKTQQARERATAFLRSRSFDGVHLLNDGSGAEVWIAFADNQIKSATDNVGTFDPRVNDRYYSRPVTD